MQLKWIEDLLVLAETKSFSRAAELRCITQSKVSDWNAASARCCLARVRV